MVSLSDCILDTGLRSYNRINKEVKEEAHGEADVNSDDMRDNQSSLDDIDADSDYKSRPTIKSPSLKYLTPKSGSTCIICEQAEKWRLIGRHEPLCHASWLKTLRNVARRKQDKRLLSRIPQQVRERLHVCHRSCYERYVGEYAKTKRKARNFPYGTAYEHFAADIIDKHVIAGDEALSLDTLQKIFVGYVKHYQCLDVSVCDVGRLGVQLMKSYDELLVFFRPFAGRSEFVVGVDRLIRALGISDAAYDFEWKWDAAGSGWDGDRKDSTNGSGAKLQEPVVHEVCDAADAVCKLLVTCLIRMWSLYSKLMR